MRLGIAPVAAVAAALLAVPARGRDGTPFAATPTSEGSFEGLVANAGRTYDCIGSGFPSGLVSFVFVAMRFDSDEDSGQARARLRRAFSSNGDSKGGMIIREVAAQWYAFEMSVDGVALKVGALYLTDGPDLNFWYAYSRRGDPLHALQGVTWPFLDDDLRPAGVPAMSPLLDRLPGADDMPPQCVLTDEATDVLVGEGTPMASTPGP